LLRAVRLRASAGPAPAALARVPHAWPTSASEPARSAPPLHSRPHSSACPPACPPALHRAPLPVLTRAAAPARLRSPACTHGASAPSPAPPGSATPGRAAAAPEAASLASAPRAREPPAAWAVRTCAPHLVPLPLTRLGRATRSPAEPRPPDAAGPAARLLPRQRPAWAASAPPVRLRAYRGPRATLRCPLRPPTCQPRGCAPASLLRPQAATACRRPLAWSRWAPPAEPCGGGDKREREKD
jgi:hypothetical protein